MENFTEEKEIVFSSIKLRNAPATCQICTKISRPYITWIDDHVHSSINQKKQSIELDETCWDCLEDGEPSCCGCFYRQENGKNNIISGFFQIICKDCTKENKIGRSFRKETFCWCIICYENRSCPNCQNHNNNFFHDKYFVDYKNLTCVCEECGHKYASKNNPISLLKK
jgi:hypothetical protein